MNPWPVIRAWFRKGSDWLDHSPLSFWTFHLCASASPAFYLVAGITRKPAQTIGMALGVVILVAFAVGFSRWIYPSEASAPQWRKALRPVVWLRSVWSLSALLALWLPLRTLRLLLLPDVVFLAVADSMVRVFGMLPLVKWLRVWIAGSDPGMRHHHFWVGDMDSVLPTLMITVIAGLLLIGLLLFVAFTRLAFLSQRHPSQP